MSLRIPRVVALAPCGFLDPRVVVAGCRAGALGALDFSQEFKLGPASAAAWSVARLTDRPFAVRLVASAIDRPWLDASPRNLEAVIVVQPHDGDWAVPLGRVQDTDRVALAEVT